MTRLHPDGIQLRTGQVRAQRYIPALLEHIERGELDPSYCLRVVFRPHGGT